MRTIAAAIHAQFARARGSATVSETNFNGVGAAIGGVNTPHNCFTGGIVSVGIARTRET